MVDYGAAHWNEVAATYDDGPDHGLLDPTIRAAWRTLLLEHLPPAPADVVDVGCGTSTLSVIVAHEGHLLRGVDSAVEMVRAAQRKAASSTVCAARALRRERPTIRTGIVRRRPGATHAVAPP
ncbi:hypothetical protein BH23ACT6_BH23ACT6_14790 [soil metagenome]